jgi:Na+/melibiose symporter-like transporter
MVPYYALGSEMTGDYHERTSLSGFRAGAVLVGMIVTTAASFLVYLPASTGEADAKFLGDSYASLGTTLGLVMILTGLAATFGTLHTRKRLARTSEAERSQRFGRTVVEALRNRPFRILLGSSCLSLVAAAINAALALHFLTYFAGINSNGVTAYMLSLYAGGLVGVVVWVRVSKLVEKHYVNAGTMMATAVIMSSGYWLFGDGRLFGTGAVGALAVANTFAGFFNVANTVVAQSMMADITAQDEQTGGRRRDGSFFGIYSLGQQLAAGIAILIAGVLVDRFAGLVPAQAAQSASTVERIALLSNVIPAVILFAAGLLSLRYPLRQQDFSN